MTKRDIYQEVTDKLIGALEAGTAPWRSPWIKGGFGFPTRSTGEHYRGINTVLLWASAEENGFTGSHWFTYRQAAGLGAQVRKGEKSTQVIYYGAIEKEIDGREEPEFIPFIKSYSVFNADQIDGLPEKFQPEPIISGTMPVDEYEAFFRNVGVIINTGGGRAFYNRSSDQVTMPPIDRFTSAAAYYGVLSHETVHWTGDKKRLDRVKGKKFGDREYAFEELVAEIGACFVSSQIGTDVNFDNSAAYLESWLAALKNDKKFIFKAASAAQKAADYITDRGFASSAIAAE